MLASLALVASGASHAQDASHAIALESFKDLCADLTSYELVHKRALTQGWRSITPESGSPQEHYADTDRRGFRNVLAKNVFSKEIETGPAYLHLQIAKEPRDGAGTGVQCRMQFPTIKDMPSDNSIAEFLEISLEEVRMETRWSSGDSRGVTTHAFRPGLGVGGDQTNLALVTPEATYEAEDGLGLIIWSMDKEGKRN